MDAVSDPAIHTVVVMSSAQIGKTEIENNIVGFHIDQDPSPILFMQPTLEMAEAWSKDRLAPMLRDTPALNGKVRDAKSRDSGNTLRHKSYPGGHITIAGANSAASLASRPIRIVLADEVDRYPPSAGTEGDPVNLAKKRSTTFWNRKLILVSTPTVKGASRIELAYGETDQRHFLVPCPHCEAEQRLVWAQAKWDSGAPWTAAYFCCECGAAWSDAERWAAIRKGRWEAQAEFNGAAGFHLSELYSPWVRLEETATAFVAAQGNPEALKVWVNTALGETWEERGEKVESHDLAARAQKDGWDGIAPAEVLVVTCGVDVQGDRLEIERLGWGVQEESWSLDHEVIYGDPSAPEIWNELDEYLARPTEAVDGRSLPVAAAAIDYGGHYADQVANFVRDKARRRIWAIKGAAGPGRPVWPKLASKNNKGRINLFIVGVDAAKDVIYGRLRIAEPGPGYCHFPADRDPGWFEQLTSEVVVTRYRKGVPVREWTPRPSIRQEALDCRVYAFAALRSMHINWGKVQRLLAAKKQEAPDNQPKPAARPAIPAQRISRSSFLGR